MAVAACAYHVTHSAARNVRPGRVARQYPSTCPSGDGLVLDHLALVISSALDFLRLRIVPYEPGPRSDSEGAVLFGVTSTIQNDQNSPEL